MLDNQLFTLIVTTLRYGLKGLGQGNIPILQSFQPTQQGVNTIPTAYLYKIGDRRRGFPLVSDVWAPSTACSFQASMLGNLMTVSGVTTGALSIGQTVTGAGVPEGVVINAFGVATNGLIGTYVLNTQGLNITVEAMTSSGGGLIHTETEQYETTFQISALATQDPSNINSLTASDILNYIAGILQSRATIATFEAQGVGILNVQDVRNPYFKDDRDLNEASPNFDFTLTHKNAIVTTMPIISSETIQILQV